MNVSKVYEVELVKDEESQVGMKEVLNEIRINNTIDSWRRAVLNVPGLTFNYGLHKLVFRFDIETFEPTIPFFKEAFTYVNITKSQLQPVLADGSPSKVSRGWGQIITLYPEQFSLDPDEPNSREFNYTWFCRAISPEADLNEWEEVDRDGFPVFNSELARGIPKPGDAMIINPLPGCFGRGAQPLKTKSGIFGFNTASLITYTRIYEILLILSKDTRRAMAKIELELGAVPAPIAEIKCVNDELCFPKFGGVFVNPTSRLAVKGNCQAECLGDEDYKWDIYRKEEPHQLNTTYCSATSIAGATTAAPTTGTTGTTTTTTTTMPEEVEEYETLLIIDHDNKYASTEVILPYSDTATIESSSRVQISKRRRKRNADLDLTKDIQGPAGDGCSYVFADGSRDARDLKELSIQQKFFDLQDKAIKEFVLKLKITKKVFDGVKYSYANGTAYLNIFINDPPENGTCTIKIKKLNEKGQETWDPAQTGRALIDEFLIQCQNWVDPNDHALKKYIFKLVTSTPKGDETTMLYAGPTSEAKVIFPVGEFRLYAEIHEEAGAYSTYTIDPKFSTVLPDEDDYNAQDIAGLLKEYSEIGDQSRVSQILQADASIRAKACWFNVTCKLASENGGVALTDLDPDKMDDQQKAKFNQLLRDVTNANTDALNSAKDNMNFDSADSLEQGSSTLYSITSNLVGSGPMSKTLDMDGRAAAVEFIEKMSDGFKKIEVPDPNKLKAFIEGVTGSAMAIMDGLNNILYSNDPDEIPLTDFEAAADMPYDTDIPEGSDADIPEDPNEALKKNAMQLTRIRAVEQVKKMTALVDEVAETTIKNSVLGEEIKTKSPLGMQMLMTKLSGAQTVGKDTDGDGIPDVPLRYEFDDSEAVVQFPLGFCPSWDQPGQDFVKDVATEGLCEGQWGFVFKEWQAITATYPESANRLNLVTRQMDIDIYFDLGGKMTIKNMKDNIIIMLERMKDKKPELVKFDKKTDISTVDVELRTSTLEIRGKPFIIYHQMSTIRPYSTINVQIRVQDPANSKLVILGRHSKLPMLKKCDFVKIVSEIELSDETYLDWFINSTIVNNRTGDWYFGVASIDTASNLTDVIKDMKSCEESGVATQTLTKDFKTKTYDLRIYTAGMYFFDVTAEAWDGIGISSINTTNLVTASLTNHLTSFATGFFPEPNKIDFEFVFAEASFTDAWTILLLLIISVATYFIAMIWATVKDIKDDKAIPLPVMRDNHPQDKYLYELIVETGPNDNHSTTSSINFILSGSECDTEVRCFDDDERQLFKKASRDGFLMSVAHPLGSLDYLRIWTDSSGLGEMSAWYLLSVIVHDIQTGEITKFVADQWLAIDRGTFEDDITIPASKEDDQVDKGYLLKAGRARVLSDDHIWWSIFTRPIRSRFNRKQRVSAAWAFLFLSYLTNAMYYGVNTEVITDPLFQFSILPMSIADIVFGLISNVIVFTPTLIIVLLFRKSKALKKRKNRVDRGIEMAKENGRFVAPEDWGEVREENDHDKKRNKGWPGFCLILAWLLTLGCIGGGGFLVFSYGIMFGNDRTYQWVTSMLVSFFSSLIITQPLKVFIIIWTIAYCSKKSKFDDDHVFVDEQLPTVYYKEDDPHRLTRPRPEKPEKRTMEPVFYAELTKRKNQEQEMKFVLREMVTYFLYLAIVFTIAYGNRDFSLFLQKQQMETKLIFGSTTCEIVPEDDPRYKDCDEESLPYPHVNFMKIKDVNHWWAWINDTVIPTVRVQNWYNGKPPYGLRGYLDDKANRLIGWGIIRQIREKSDSCTPAKEVRDSITECSGEQGIGYEDHNDWCLGWIHTTYPNCTPFKEFEYTDSTTLKSLGTTSGIRDYGGGGYILELRGYIGDLLKKIELLQKQKWVDKKTRATILEFSVYNAQVNIFTTVTCVAEFVGGGIVPWYRIKTFRLFSNEGIGAYIVMFAEILFVASTFYYIVNLLAVLKKEGRTEFCQNKWNWADILTIVMSVTAIGLYVAKKYVVLEMLKTIEKTKGNRYERLDMVSLINETYEYVMAFTVFFSTIKFSKLISFHKAFMQISATIKLCFSGLSTFVVEFSIVFGGFSAFFFFALKNDLENFRDFIRTLENTLAMSIGKFNFGALREADEMSAWIFFAFSIVVNMILINMMMAIINLAFEEIKSNKSDFQNKFELVDYVKRSAKEMIGTQIAEPIVPIYTDGNTPEGEEEVDEATGTERVSQEFTEKTDLLLAYIEQTYLKEGFVDTEEGRRVMAKMSLGSNGGQADEKKVMEYGFDAIFMGENKK